MKKLLSFGVSAILLSLLVAAVPVFAESIVSSTTATSSKARRTFKLEEVSLRLQTRAAKEIDRRIAGLTKLQSKILEMKRVSETQKNSFTTTVQGQINLLNNLKIKIAADTDTATLKSDLQSVTRSYRIYALVMPQIAIIGAADRLSSTADLLSAFEVKLQARVTIDQTSGKDVTSLQASLNDMTAKIADAKTQAAAAISGVSGLKPDNGDKTIMTANTEALKKAREAIKTGIQDLRVAHQDGMAVRLGLKKIDGITASSSIKTSTSTKRQNQ